MREEGEMALKGRNWFFGKCLTEERSRTKLAFLSGRVLDLGLSGREHTQGHISQACGAVQVFLSEFTNHKRTLREETPVDPYKIQGNVLRDWISFLSRNSGNYGKRFCGYNWDTLKSCITRKYGGNCSGGGGGDNELEIVLRLMAEFI